MESINLEMRRLHVLPHDATDGDVQMAIWWPYGPWPDSAAHRPCSVCKHTINTWRSLSPEVCDKSHAMPTALFFGRSVKAQSCHMLLP